MLFIVATTLFTAASAYPAVRRASFATSGAITIPYAVTLDTNPTGTGIVSVAAEATALLSAFGALTASSSASSSSMAPLDTALPIVIGTTAGLVATVSALLSVTDMPSSSSMAPLPTASLENALTGFVTIIGGATAGGAPSVPALPLTATATATAAAGIIAGLPVTLDTALPSLSVPTMSSSETTSGSSSMESSESSSSSAASPTLPALPTLSTDAVASLLAALTVMGGESMSMAALPSLATTLPTAPSLSTDAVASILASLTAMGGESMSMAALPSLATTLPTAPSLSTDAVASILASLTAMGGASSMMAAPTLDTAITEVIATITSAGVPSLPTMSLPAVVAGVNVGGNVAVNL